MKHLLLFILTIATLAVASSCEKYDPGDDPCPACPKIDYLEPDHARGGDIVTIHGSNFNPNSSANIIKLNGIQIGVDSILNGDTETLSVFVPQKCGTGPVTVDVDEELNFSGAAPIFTYDFSYTVSHYAGSTRGENGLMDGIDTIPRFFDPSAMEIDLNDNLYVSDWNFSYTEASIRKVTPTTNLDGISVGEVTTIPFSTVIPYIADMSIDQNTNQIYLVGDPGLSSLYSGNLNSAPISVTYLNPNENTGRNISSVEKVGNSIYAYDNDNLKIVEFNLLGATQMFEEVIGSGSDTTMDGVGNQASIGFGGGLAYDQEGNLYFSEQEPFNTIRSVDLANSSVTTISGTFGVNAVIDGPLDACSYKSPSNLVFNQDGDLYLSDYSSKGIRVISDGSVTTIAGSSALGYQNGDGTQATFNYIRDIVVDSHGDLFVLTGTAIRKITIK